ncbi:MAG: hypothetical protein LBE76_08850 [Nitrososphaerota archaeon]|nr:hypothetical protein [Nitrososphaerota archaeon]
MSINHTTGSEPTSWTKLADMPTSRGGLGLAVASEKIFAIGGSNKNGNLATNEMYDPITNKWSTKASMPTARTGFATVVHENKIYVIGGSVGDSFIDNVEVYNPNSDTWQTLSSMPTPRADLAANVVGDKIYLIGGKIYSNNSPYYTQTDKVEIYDIKTNTWSTSTSMPISMQGSSSSVIGTKIYIIGGSKQSDTRTDTSTTNLQIYDTQTSKWTNGSSLLYPSSYGATVATTGVMAATKIYYTGGFSLGAFSDKTQIYDIEHDSWSEGPKMSTVRAYLDSATINDIIYAIGGFDGEQWLNRNEKLTPTDYGKVPPIIEVLSPENKTYQTVQITYRVNKAVSWIGFSLDNNKNVTLTNNNSYLTDIPDGTHTIILYANDTLGNIGASQKIHFTIDNTAPIITILTPTLQIYNTADIMLTFTINKPVAYIAYSLNGQPEVQINGNITLPALSDGNHKIIINAKDELGNSGSSDEITFRISTFPIFWIVTAIVLITIFITSGYLIIKHKKLNHHQPKPNF